MKVYQVKTDLYSGSSYSEIYPKARKLYNRIKGQTKRQPYVRSKFFKGQKVFIELYWVHITQKSQRERNKRIKFYASGIELTKNSRMDPTIKKNPNKSNELMYRFAGITPSGDLFYVQIKENIKTKRKDLMSIFPV